MHLYVWIIYQKNIKGNLHPDAPGGMEQLMLPAPNNTTKTASTPSHNTNAPRTSRLGRVRGQQRSWTNQSVIWCLRVDTFDSHRFFCWGGAPAWLRKKQESFEKQTFQKRGCQPQVAMRLGAEKNPKMTFKKKSYFWINIIHWNFKNWLKLSNNLITLNFHQAPWETIVWVGMFWEVYAPWSHFTLRSPTIVFPIPPWSLT